MRLAPAVAATRRAVRASIDGIDKGDLVLAGVSGGADSLALAAALAWEAPKAGLRAGAVTIDHGLQPGSDARAEEVAGVCRNLGLDPVVVQAADVGSAGGPEAAARVARYAALDDVAERLGTTAVLLAHTLDDQAETVLLRLARGSGARSLAGMSAVSGRYRRPFLTVRRTETLAACAALGLQPWHDPHNFDRVYTRVRVRLDLLPALEEALGPGVAEALARTADLLRDDADALDAMATSEQGELDAPRLSALPAAVRRRLLRNAAIEAGAPAGSLTAAHLRAIDDLVVDWHGQGPVSLPGGLVAERRCDSLSFR